MARIGEGEREQREKRKDRLKSEHDMLFTNGQKLRRIEHLNQHIEKIQSEVIDSLSSEYERYIKAVEAEDYSTSNKLSQTVWKRSEANLAIIRACNEKRRLLREIYPDVYRLDNGPRKRNRMLLVLLVVFLIATSFATYALVYKVRPADADAHGSDKMAALPPAAPDLMGVHVYTNMKTCATPVQDAWWKIESWAS